MVNAPVNATGWEQLIDGHMINATYTMFNEAFLGNGLIIIILFVLYQFMLYRKTENFALMFIVGALFAGMYVASMTLQAFAAQIIFVILILELTGMLIMTFFF